MIKSATLYLPLLGFLVACSSATPCEPTPPMQAAAAIDAFAQETMRAAGTPGLTIAVTTDTDLLHVGTYGYADLNAARPVDETTLFQIGSISKSFTALAILQLEDQGLLDVRAPIVQYLPWFSVQNQYSPIQVHHLLTHSAGLPANRDNLTHSPLMAVALRDRTVAWNPGERYHYSNIGYQTLHFLLESVGGRSYKEQIQTGILKPLGMTRTQPIITLESRAEQAVGYVPPFDDRPHHPSRALAEAPHFDYWIGDGSIQSTAGDMAAYLRMLLNAGRGPNGPLVSRKAFETFSKGHISVRPGSSYGYGIRVTQKDGREILEHSGGMVGFSAYMQADHSSRLGAVALINGPGDVRKVVEYALEVMRAVHAGEAILPPPGIPHPAHIENASEYEGRYRNGSKSLTLAAANDSRLVLRWKGEQINLEHRGQDTFYTPHPAFDRYFLHCGRDESGEVNRLTHGPSLLWKVGFAERTEKTSDQNWHVFTGHFRSYSPWLSYFEVLEREGSLILITGESGESTSGETRLAPVGPGSFRVGTRLSPEILEFEELVEGRALKAVWSGHPFYRTP